MSIKDQRKKIKLLYLDKVYIRKFNEFKPSYLMFNEDFLNSDEPTHWQEGVK